MSKDLKIKSFDPKPILRKFSKHFGRHALFAAILVVLLSYLLVVFKISSLAKAEPDPSQTTTAPALIPRIDQKTVSQIQSLEQSNTQLHSLFESARNNPFQE